MKLKPFILPVVTLAVVGSWVGPQRRAMAAAEAECARLRTRLATVSFQPSAASHDPLEMSRKVIEWTNISSHFRSNPMMSSIIFSGALPDERVALRFRRRMEAMSADEVIATLDELAALDLPPECRENLEWTLFDALVRKDPVMALKLMEDRDVSDHFLFGNLICGALQAWAKQESAGAGAWLDDQIIAGKFRSKALNGVNDARQMYEAALIGTLLGASPDAAARRLAALPEDQRGNVLHMYSLTNVPESNQLAHADLIRALVPEKDQARAIASQASLLFKPGDYSAVTAYLERIHATPSERTACAMQASRNMHPKIPGTNQLTRDDIEGLREWVGSQAPDCADKVTGEALGEAAQGNRKLDFATAAGLAVEYNSGSGNDEVLATFLASWAARNNKEAARAFAGKISDEKRRAEILAILK